ncbi:MAG: stage II sporulation protein P [Oscillospiraceae bacterium]|nr:stage II sporulation protein P [Oscillospiraceae bacterium]
MEQKVLRLSGGLVLLALLIRLLSSSLPARAAEFFISPRVSSFLLFLETGYTLRPVCVSFSEPSEVSTEAPTQTTLPTLPQPTQPEPMRQVFSQSECELLELSGSLPDALALDSLVEAPLQWDLQGDSPTVLIFHSHGTESYKDSAGVASSAYHTLNPNHNMVSVGELLAARLEAAGIGVIHDRTLHDQPSYSDAYVSSRTAAESYLEQYPSIQLVLDLHRDSCVDKDGNQLPLTVDTDDDVAQLMLVVGTDQGGFTHPQWQKNLSLGVKLQLQLERLCPGICRPINLRNQRFNQDLSAGALLVEVGAAGNTKEQALQAAQVLADAIIALAPGANY